MDKKGVSLVELLAAIVLFGILAALVSTILTTIIRANREIQIATQANSQGNFLVTVIESELSKFELDTTISPNCSGTSCVLTSSKRFILVNDELILNQDIIQLTLIEELNGLRITLENLTTATVLSDKYFEVDYFELNLSINSTTTVDKFRVQISIELIDEYSKPHLFLTSYVYELPE
ncbi:MAG: type II secretion system protein [Acholeplasmataceae bacterium]|nr:type II secretion system protein [Acholeplasmataceae bacterium]